MTARLNRALPRTTLSAQILEDRTVPAFWGTPWPAADAITLSFAKEGAKFSTGGENNLFQKDVSDAQTDVYRREILRAYQAWLGPVNVNIGVVADDGYTLGAPGPLQGSSKYGDIRIAGLPLGTAANVATATPFDLLGAGAGDLVFNTSVPYSIGGGNGTYDLFTVALQEAGHTLGLAGSNDPTSAMFGSYTGVRTGPSAADLAALRSIYSARLADRFDTERRDATPSPLTFVESISNLENSNDTSYNTGEPGIRFTVGNVPAAAAGDIASAADRDTYSVDKPQGKKELEVNFRTSGLSLLNAKVSIVSPSGVVLKTASATDPLNGNLKLFTSVAEGRGTYKIVVEANAATAFTSGRYRVSAGIESAKAIYPSISSDLLNPDEGTDDTLGQARDMPGQALSLRDRWQGDYRASLKDKSDKDFYRVAVPAESVADTLVATVWGTEAGKLDPNLRVYDAAGRSLAFDLIGQDSSSLTLQVRGVAAGQTYFVEVLPTSSAGDKQSQGNYVLAVDLRSGALQLPAIAQEALSSTDKEVAYKFTAEAGRLNYFQLTATGSASDVAVRATVYDSQGRAVGSFGVFAGKQAAMEFRLASGEYTIRITSGKKSGGAYTAGFVLGGMFRDDPIGPVAVGGDGGSVQTRIRVIRVAAAEVVLPAYQDPWFGL